MTRFLVTANSDAEDYNANCDFALVTFSSELLRKLKRLRASFLAQKKRYPDLTEWHLSAPDALFISRKAAKVLLGDVVFEDMEEAYVGIPFHVSHERSVDLETVDATNADEVVLSADGVWWRVFPKHAEISVGSDFFSWDWLARCSHCGLRRDEHIFALGFSHPKCTFFSTSFKPLLPEPTSGVQARRRNSQKR